MRRLVIECLQRIAIEQDVIQEYVVIGGHAFAVIFLDEPLF